MPTTELVEETRDHGADVEAWRLHVLLKAGYPVGTAEQLARSSADLHRAVEILECGCQPQLAAQILA